MTKMAPPDVRHISMPIVYQDKSIVVVDKPAGLLSVPGTSPGVFDSVQERVSALYAFAEGPLIVHRLDMATSGLLVLGLSEEPHRHLSVQFLRRRVTKVYEAILDGSPDHDRSEIELAFRKDFDDKPKQKLDAVDGKMGVTKWRVMGMEGRHVRVEFFPLTGRTHQLRLHASHELGLGVPILGDALYGNKDSAERLMLHARELVFEHPSTRRVMSFVSPTPF